MKKSIFTVAISLLTTICLAQDLEATLTEALVNVSTVNSNGEPKPGEKISFTAEDGKVWSVVTNDLGLAQLLIPKGSKYTITYMTLEGNNEYSQIEIPDAEGRVQFDLKLEFEPPKVYTLKNVTFETGSSVVRSSSYPSLDQLVELMEIKSTMRIEISGHTDNVGDPIKNQQLSQKRANSVREYLIRNGISADRVSAVGHGQDRPVASNGSELGRQENRRTEVRILQE